MFVYWWGPAVLLNTSIKYYSLISELKNTRWKVDIAKPIILNS